MKITRVNEILKEDGTEAETLRMIEEISCQIGFALASSIRYARAKSQEDRNEKADAIEMQWTKLADMVMEFALEEE